MYIYIHSHLRIYCAAAWRRSTFSLPKTGRFVLPPSVMPQVWYEICLHYKHTQLWHMTCVYLATDMIYDVCSFRFVCIASFGNATGMMNVHTRTDTRRYLSYTKIKHFYNRHGMIWSSKFLPAGGLSKILEFCTGVGSCTYSFLIIWYKWSKNRVHKSTLQPNSGFLETLAAEEVFYYQITTRILWDAVKRYS